MRYNIIYIWYNILTLAELEATTCFGTSGLFALYLAAVACHKAFGTECLLILSVDLHQCACNSQAQSLRLAGVTATCEINFDVVLLDSVNRSQGLLNHELQDSAGEIFSEVTLVDGNLTRTLCYIDAGNGALTATKCINYFHLS